MLIKENKFSLRNITKGKPPSLPFVILKDKILGDDYSLSVAYVTEKVSRELNKKWRGKDSPTNVLSFTLSKNSGELVLCPTIIKKEIKIFERTYRELLGFLVIHGMLHLKGYEHSSRMKRARMESEENKYDQKYFSRHRRGLLHDSSSSRRIHKGRKKS